MILSEARFDQFILAWLILALCTFVTLMFVNAPYGRYIRSGWGVNIPAKLGWITMESPTIIIMSFYFYIQIINQELLGSVNTLFYVLWMSHYVHRTLIWPLRAQMNKKRMPISIVFFAIFFNIINTTINAENLFKIHNPYPEHWFMSPQFVLGMFVFIIGMGINISSDNILIKIRKQNQDGYVIPDKGLYNWVSSPNYLGEILEWTGWAIATWSLGGFSFAIWVMANLIPRARSNHLWYLENFNDYPKKRKILIPMIW
jgi:protein-S-isoprenylcysteine O-methyltransferase Ste14